MKDHKEDRQVRRNDELQGNKAAGEGLSVDWIDDHKEGLSNEL